jgi:hypothetical protein
MEVEAGMDGLTSLVAKVREHHREQPMAADALAGRTLAGVVLAGDQLRSTTATTLLSTVDGSL